MLTGIVAVAAVVSVASAQNLPQGNPFQQLQALSNAIAAQVTQLSTAVWGLQTRVANLEASVGALQSSAVRRTVVAGTIDLNSPGDVVLDAVAPDNIRRVRHLAAFAVPGLTTDDPPTISWFQRRRTDSTPPFATTTGFVASNLLATPASTLGGFSVFTDPTLVVVEDGRVLIQFRFESFSPASSPTPNIVRYGLDGPGGTGEFRLVLLR